MNRQLFILPSEIWESTTRQDIIKTTNDMYELGIFKPPFTEFDIHSLAPQRIVAEWIYDKKIDVVGSQADSGVGHRYRYKFLENGDYEFLIAMKNEKNRFDYYSFSDEVFMDTLRHESSILKMDFDEFMSIFEKQVKNTSRLMVSMLIVCLAAKNIKKETQEIKRHGPKSKKRSKEYRYITTIKIGKITETMRSDGASGSSVRPHLRRGHIRNQHFGEGNKEIKKIFIQPVFVNADEGWIDDQRKAYVVKAA